MGGVKHTGDDGYTRLLGAGRVAKDHGRIEALGALDEANAALGIARSFSSALGAPELLVHIQRDLYTLMSEVASTPQTGATFRTVGAGHVEWLEQQVERIQPLAAGPGEFIVPGDSPGGAFLDLARAVVRRAERRVAALFHQGELQNGELLRYLNRLSTLIFTIELWENRVAGIDRLTLAKEKQEHDGNPD